MLGLFEGLLVSDGWKPYWSYPALDHALCCAHLLRDLASVAEVPTQTAWADAMADLLVEAKNTLEAALGHDSEQGGGGVGADREEPNVIERSRHRDRLP